MKPKYSITMFWFNLSTAVAFIMKFSSQISIESLYDSHTFAPCIPPYDPTDSVAHRGSKLESPAGIYREKMVLIYKMYKMFAVSRCLFS